MGEEKKPPRGDNDGEALVLWSKLKTLRLAFIDALIGICERRDEKNQLIPPSGTELSVIRGVLRDNGMALNLGDDGREELEKIRKNEDAADLPEFDDDEYGDE